MISKELYPKAKVLLQVVDFSPVIGVFHVFSPIFHPISQPQGFGFSPVTRFMGDNFCVLGRMKVEKSREGGGGKRKNPRAPEVRSDWHQARRQAGLRPIFKMRERCESHELAPRAGWSSQRDDPTSWKGLT